MGVSFEESKIRAQKIAYLHSAPILSYVQHRFKPGAPTTLPRGRLGAVLSFLLSLCLSLSEKVGLEQ